MYTPGAINYNYNINHDNSDKTSIDVNQMKHRAPLPVSKQKKKRVSSNYFCKNMKQYIMRAYWESVEVFRKFRKENTQLLFN